MVYGPPSQHATVRPPARGADGSARCHSDVVSGSATSTASINVSASTGQLSTLSNCCHQCLLYVYRTNADLPGPSAIHSSTFFLDGSASVFVIIDHANNAI